MRFSHTDQLSSVDKMLLYGKQEKFNSFDVVSLFLLTFCLQMTVSGLDAGLKGKFRLRSISISAHQILEFCSSQSL